VGKEREIRETGIIDIFREDERMKALTIWQPWAQLLAEGKKHNETRSWGTKYRGPILIHSAKAASYNIFCVPDMDEDTLKYFIKAGLKTPEDIENLPRGCIVGMAQLVDCKHIDQTYHDFIRDLCPEEYAFGDFRIGRYAWELKEPVLFDKPMPASGKQGLWNYERSVPNEKD
jgi:hypothetical protein